MKPIVRIVDGEPVLEDPTFAGVVAAVEHHNLKQGKIACMELFELNQDRVQHFQQRINEKGLTPDQVVIVLINVDDPHGGDIADVLMPGYDWQQYRDQGQLPVARGLADRGGIQKAVDVLDKREGDHLRDIKGIAVVVIDGGTARVFSID